METGLVRIAGRTQVRTSVDWFRIRSRPRDHQGLSQRDILAALLIVRDAPLNWALASRSASLDSTRTLSCSAPLL